MLPNVDDIGRFALFLDLDGTVAEIAERPDAVRVDAATIALLDALRRAAGDALAVVSGRDITVVDRAAAVRSRCRWRACMDCSDATPPAACIASAEPAPISARSFARSRRISAASPASSSSERPAPSRCIIVCGRSSRRNAGPSPSARRASGPISRSCPEKWSSKFAAGRRQGRRHRGFFEGSAVPRPQAHFRRRRCDG